MISNKNIVKMYIRLISLGFAFVASLTAANAQVNTFNAQFYQNEYLANPAMAGAKTELKVNLGIKDRFRNVKGAPNSQYLTGDIGLNKNSGFGVTLNQYSVNILSRTQIAAAYAYHLPINEDSKLHFGISANFVSQKLSYSKIIGNSNDPLIGDYNERKPVFDSDFGIAYTFKKLTLQAVVYNGIQQIAKKNDVVDLNKFYAAAAYRLNYKNFGLTPKISYRKIDGFDSIYDGGLELTAFNDEIKLSGIYHSNESFSAGLSYEFMSKFQFLMMFNSQSSANKNYSPEEFEIGLRIRFAKSNK